MDSLEAPHDNFMLPEILEEILGYAWYQHMHHDERRTLFVSLSLVSKLWLSVFTRVCTKDVFILSHSAPCFHFYYKLFYGQLPSIVIREEDPASLRNLCVSLTRQIIFHSDSRPQSRRARRDLHTAYMHDFMMTFHRIPFLPNLHSLSVRHYAKIGSRPARHSSTITVSIVQLKVQYEIAPDVDQWQLDELGIGMGDARITKYLRLPPCAGADLEHASFPLADADAASDDAFLDTFVSTYPHLQRVVYEQGRIRVRILSSSSVLPPGCIIVHGAMDPSTYVRVPALTLEPNPIFGPPIEVRGDALGYVIEGPSRPKDSVTGEDAPVLNTWRAVNIYIPKRKRYY